jgi:hypothetical protein
MIRSMPILVLALAACGSRQTPTRGDTAAAKDDKPAGDAPGPPPPTKQVLIAWFTEPTTSGPAKTKVALATTDEMGRVANHPIGEFDGTCTDVGPIALYQADTALTCGQNGVGVQLHAAAGRGEVLVFAMDIAEGTEPDPMARRQIARIEVAMDAKITVAP